MSTTTSANPRRRALTAAGIGVATAALVLAAPIAASAHVHVTPTSTEAGATSELAFSFSHGCDGSPTTAVEVSIPDEVTAVALIANAGWQVESAVVDGARTVAFTADRAIPDGVRETLELEVTLPEGAADGTVLAFPTLQSCEVGETLWGDVDPEADAPAPTITIGAAAHGHGAGDDDTAVVNGGSGEASAAAEDDTEAAETTEDGQAPAADGSASSDGTAAGAVQESSPAMPIAIAGLVVSVLAAALAAFAAFRRRS